MKNMTALVGMSGGVDSSVTAALLLRRGWQVLGATMQLCPGEGISETFADARRVADALGINHLFLDCRAEFEESVIRPFVDAYESGLTPNPCIQCNRALKFGILLDKATALGCQVIATGHYARIRRDPDTGRYLLYKAADRAKDQTYFLAGLNQHQLAHAAFPLGELTKSEVRAIAEEIGLVNAHRRDSQDICFIPDGDYASFLRRYTGKVYPEGDYLDLAGNVVGRHKGAVNYTLGQRKGLGIALGAPVYVCAKDMEKSTVTLGPNEALYSPALVARDWNWLPFPALEAPMEVTAKIRHSQTEIPATVTPLPDGTARVDFAAPQRAVTPGQAVVLYQGDLVIGSGTIVKAAQLPTDAHGDFR